MFPPISPASGQHSLTLSPYPWLSSWDVPPLFPVPELFWLASSLCPDIILEQPSLFLQFNDHSTGNCHYMLAPGYHLGVVFFHPGTILSPALTTTPQTRGTVSVLWSYKPGLQNVCSYMALGKTSSFILWNSSTESWSSSPIKFQPYPEICLCLDILLSLFRHFS